MEVPPDLENTIQSLKRQIAKYEEILPRLKARLEGLEKQRKTFQESPNPKETPPKEEILPEEQVLPPEEKEKLLRYAAKIIKETIAKRERFEEYKKALAPLPDEFYDKFEAIATNLQDEWRSYKSEIDKITEAILEAIELQDQELAADILRRIDHEWFTNRWADALAQAARESYLLAKEYNIDVSVAMPLFDEFGEKKKGR